MCWHSFRQLGLHKAAFFFYFIDSGQDLSLSTEIAPIILEIKVQKLSLSWSGGNIKKVFAVTYHPVHGYGLLGFTGSTLQVFYVQQLHNSAQNRLRIS